MDPHSRILQYNQRAPRTRPCPPPSRFTEHSLDNTPKRSSKKPLRLMASSPRVTQDEKYQKDMYLAFVVNSLEQLSNGVSEPFNELVDQFNPNRKVDSRISLSQQLRLWLLALSHVLSRLERCHAPLVEAIVNMAWTTMDNSFVKSYTMFVGMLLSAKPEYLSLVLDNIAQGFTYQYGLQVLDANQPESSSSPLTRGLVYDRQHYLLRHLLTLIPTLPSTLQPFLIRHFPHKRQQQIAQTTYIRNLLRVTDYCPEIAERILATIIGRVIQIDVEIQAETEELDDMMSAQNHEGIFDIDPFDALVGQDANGSDSESDSEGGGEDHLSDISSDAEAMDDDSEVADIPSNLRHIQDMVKKLDAVLKVLFDHFNRIHVRQEVLPSSHIDPLLYIDDPQLASPVPLSNEQIQSIRHSQFHILLSIFDSTIIRTFNSRYTQFLVFWYSSLDPEYTDLFQGFLVSKALLEQDQAVVTRAAAASYIASYISRAQFVDRESARRVMSVLCNFLKTHLDAFDLLVQIGCSMPGHAHHSVFYAVAQATLLIFCFRWRDMLDEDEDEDEVLVGPCLKRTWMVELGVLQRAVTSSLNPLKVCSSNVVLQFARVAQRTDFLYCYSIIEANRRSDYNKSHTGDVIDSQHKPNTPVHPAILGNAINPELHSFFPFDPYKLPKSSSYIQNIYREWSTVAIDCGEEDDEEDDESYDEGEGDEQDVSTLEAHRLGIPLEDQDDSGLNSFGSMSISPAYVPLSR